MCPAGQHAHIPLGLRPFKYLMPALVKVGGKAGHPGGGREVQQVSEGADCWARWACLVGARAPPSLAGPHLKLCVPGRRSTAGCGRAWGWACACPRRCCATSPSSSAWTCSTSLRSMSSSAPSCASCSAATARSGARARPCAVATGLYAWPAVLGARSALPAAAPEPPSPREARHVWTVSCAVRSNLTSTSQPPLPTPPPLTVQGQGHPDAALQHLLHAGGPNALGASRP